MGKKKRIVDVKNKNNGTGRQIKKPQQKNANTNNSIEKVAASYDKHHNTSRPCSSIASIIAQEIFPALPQPSKSTSTDVVTCNYGESPTDDKKCACIYCSLKDPSLLPITTGKLLLTQQPLLAFIILQHLINERKKVRTNIEEEKKQKEEEIRIKTEEIITLLATKSKKKATGNQKLISQQAAAKKEDNEDSTTKKDDNEEDGNNGKKKSEEEVDLSILSKEELTDVISVGTMIGKALRGVFIDDKKEEVAVEEEKSDEGWLEGCDEESSYDPPPELSDDDDSSSEDSDIAEIKQILTGGGIPSRHADSDESSSDEEEDEPLTMEEEMDLLLDSYIDSKEACDILDNEAKKKWANRDLESFVQFLLKKFDNRKKSDKNKPLKLQDILPTISANVAYELLDPVRCRSCRFSATSHLQCLLCDETGRHGFVTKTNNPPADNDYTITMTDTTVSAMSNKVESGRKGWNSQSSLHLELRPISKSSDGFKYLQVGTALKGSGIVFDYPMNLQDILNLTKHIILPKNTNNEQITSYSDLSDDKLAAIAKEAFESVRTLVRVFEKASNILEVTVKNDLPRAAAAAKNHHAFATCKESCSCDDCVDMRTKETKKILKDCNMNCNLVLTEMSNLLVELFKSTVFVGWSTSISPNLLQSLQNLWDRYNGTLDSLLQPVYHYRNKLLGLSYKLKAHEREMNELDFLKDLVDTKIMTVGKLVKDLGTAITEQAGTPNCIVVLHVLQSYRLAKEPNVTIEEAIYPDKEGEELFLSLVESRTNLLKRVTGIYSLTEDGPEEARNEITHLNKNAIRLVTSIKNTEGIAIEFLANRHKVAESSYYEFDKRSKSDWKDNRDGLIKRKKGSDCAGTEIGDSTTLLAQSFWCCMQMLAVFSSQQNKKSSMNSLVLPPRLESWINNTVGIDASQANNFHNTCVGSCGGRRVSSIFSGLIYRWLEERAKEWNAELEQNELFQSMEKPSVVNAKSGKKKKKKSKKKKASAAINKTNSKPDLVESSTNDDMSKSSRGDQSEGIQSIDDTDDRMTEYNTLQSTSSPEEEEDHTVENSSRGSGDSEEVYSAAGESNSPDLVDEDPSVADLPPTSSVNHMHENGDIHDDTATLIRTARSRFKEQLISNEDDLDTVNSIEPNIRTIQALLTSNEVIYERCRGHIESGTDEKTMFTKADYSVADAHYDEVTSMFQFVTYPEHCRMEFNTFPLSNLPFTLDFGSFSGQLRYKGNPGSCESSFIDYDILFESSFVLHPDIQSPFLAKLKNHLECVQACLYRINDWLSIPSKNLNYLQESFGEEKLQMSNKTIKHFCVEGSHVHDDICLQCERAFSLHKVEALKIQGMEGHRRLCPHPEDKDLPYFMCSKCDPDSEVQCPHYQVEESYVLREFNWNATFKKGMSYDISTEQGRLQLKNFVSFIEKATSSSGESWVRQS